MKDGFAGLVRAHVKRIAITGGLEAAHLLSRARLMGGARGRGAVFTLHHVRPKVPRSFDPNAHLEITPEFLEDAILTLKRDGYRFIPLDELPTSLTSAGTRPLACFTLDDGYRNNLDHALPVFEQHGVPFTVFVTAGYVERTHTLWWETLPELLSVSRRFRFDFGTGEEIVASESLAQKQAVFDRLATYIHKSDEADAIVALNRAACEHGVDPLAITERLTLDEAGLRRLIRSPLASLGGHTISHRAIARLSHDEARREISGSAGCVAAITGHRPSSFAFPYGDRPSVSPRDHRLVAELGIPLAVTTQPAMLAEAKNLHALPRISLNGHFQNARYVTALGSGIPFRLFARSAG